ncbi:MAG: STAS domain-containing protein [Planctomycetota bacterium]
MPIQQWEDNIILVDLADEPSLSDDLTSLADRFEESGASNTVLNFGEVSHINSSNISQLLRLRKLSMDSDTDLILCAINESVWGVLIVAGLDKIFRCTPDLLTALATVQLDEEP